MCSPASAGMFPVWRICSRHYPLHPGSSRILLVMRRRGGTIRQRKAGDLLVFLRQSAQFVLSDVLVEIVKRPVADQFLDLDIDEIRRMLAIGAHDARRGVAALILIVAQRVYRLIMGGKTFGK